MPKSQRQSTLASNFFFICKCSRCENEPKFMSGYRCIDPNCSGVVTQGTKKKARKQGLDIDDTLEEKACDKCGKARDIADLNAKVQQATGWLESALQTKKIKINNEAILKLLRKAIAQFQQVLHAYNAVLLANIDKAMSTCIGIPRMEVERRH